MWWNIFGKKNISKAVDLVDDSIRGVGSWIDEQQFTEEEKSQEKKNLLI